MNKIRIPEIGKFLKTILSQDGFFEVIYYFCIKVYEVYNKMIKSQDTLERNSDIHVANVSGVTILLDAKKSNILGLNEIGDYIFKLLPEQPVKVENIVNHLSDTFSIDTKKCLKDITPFLEKMVKEKIFKLSTAGTYEENSSPSQLSFSNLEFLDWEAPKLTR
jgi:hypothetical protein